MSEELYVRRRYGRGRGAAIVRALRLLQALEQRSRRGLSISEAQQVCGDETVHERTIRRDLETLGEVFPVDRFRLGESKGWRFRLNREELPDGLLMGGAR